MVTTHSGTNRVVAISAIILAPFGMVWRLLALLAKQCLGHARWPEIARK
jgi:hypothetical protein